MNQHKFKPASGLVSAVQVSENVAASEEKLREGVEIARRLEEGFGQGKDLAARVGYPDVDRLRKAITCLESITQMRDELEGRCDEVKQDLDGNLRAMQALVLASPAAAHSAVADHRATIGAIVLRLLPLVVTDLPAVLDGFPSLKDAFASDLVEFRQTQISSGDVDSEQLEELRQQVALLEEKCETETSKCNKSVRAATEAKSSSEKNRQDADKQRQLYRDALQRLAGAEKSLEEHQDELSSLHDHVNNLVQTLQSESNRAARYRRERESALVDLKASEQTVTKHAANVKRLHGQLNNMIHANSTPQDSRLGTVSVLDKDLDNAEKSRREDEQRHLQEQANLARKHKVDCDLMQQQIDKLMSENSKMRSDISSKDSELSKAYSDCQKHEGRNERLRLRVEDYKKYFEQAKAQRAEAKDQWAEDLVEKDAVISEKNEVIKQKTKMLAEKETSLNRSRQNEARLREERNQLRKSHKEMAASSDDLKEADARISQLEEEVQGWEARLEVSEKNLDLAVAGKETADSALAEKDAELKQMRCKLGDVSNTVTRLDTQISQLREQVENGRLEQEGLRDDVERLEGLIETKDHTINAQKETIDEKTSQLIDSEARMIVNDLGQKAELDETKTRLATAKEQLAQRTEELDRARETRKTAVADLAKEQESSEERAITIKSLENTLQGLQASSSASARENTENSRRVSVFLADMAGYRYGEVAFGSLVRAIYEGVSTGCASAAPAAWTILRSWNGLPADLAATAFGAYALPSHIASLQMGVVLLLGEATMGRLNSPRSQAILDGLIVSIRGTKTVPVQILTELVGSVSGALQEQSGHFQIEFALAFWQMMDLVECRLGQPLAAGLPWHGHKASLSLKLEQHPCALVFDIIRNRVDPHQHELCRLFGESVGLCSHRDWPSAVLFDTSVSTLRFVDKALVSMNSLRTMRIGPEPGHEAVDLRLQPPDLIWQLKNI